jgi:hypothetical protein
VRSRLAAACDEMNMLLPKAKLVVFVTKSMILETQDAFFPPICFIRLKGAKGLLLAKAIDSPITI